MKSESISNLRSCCRSARSRFRKLTAAPSLAARTLHRIGSHAPARASSRYTPLVSRKPTKSTGALREWRITGARQGAVPRPPSAEVDMRKAVASLIILGLATPAFAADRYQIFPYAIVSSTSTAAKALLIDTTAGTIYDCKGVLGLTTPHIQSVGCQKGAIESGSLPAGPVTPGWQQDARGAFPAIWQVNQTNGDVTWCAPQPNAAGLSQWYCGLAHLPK